MSIAVNSGSNNNNTYSEIASAEEVVDGILSNERNKILDRIAKLKAKKSNRWKSYELDLKRVASRREEYLHLETIIRENPTCIPRWELGGPLHYGMTLPEMKSRITAIFLDLFQSGQLMLETQLNKNDRSRLFPEEGEERKDLTRIWGANYLASNLPTSGKLAAAKHYLVISNNEPNITIKVAHSPHGYPMIIRASNSKVLSDKIDGDPSAKNGSYLPLIALQYADFQDSGNIITNNSGKSWVVDTEQKSFDPPILDRDEDVLLQYSKKRFQVLSGGEYHSLYQTITIPLSCIGLSSEKGK